MFEREEQLLLNNLNYAGYIAESALNRLVTLDNEYETLEKQASVEENNICSTLGQIDPSIYPAGLFYLSKNYEDSVKDNSYIMQKEAAIQELESAQALYNDSMEKLAYYAQLDRNMARQR